MVPLWFRLKNAKIVTGSRLAPSTLLTLLFAAACAAYGSLFLSVLSDWAGFVVREGYTTYGAQRLREGEWPYRDFFFLWTPGMLALHALLQELGASAAVERGLSLLAAAGSAALVLHEARRWKLLLRERWLLVALLFLWSFPLWNIPYSSWIAIFCVLAGLRGRALSWAWVGAGFGLAFWFKQNIALQAAAGLLIALAWRGEGRALRSFLLPFLGIVIVPFVLALIYPGPSVVGPALNQIFLFPFRYPALMGKALPAFALGSPLITVGLWVCSLYLSRADKLPRNLARMLAVAHATYAIATEGREYFSGLFLVLSLVGWVGALLFVTQEEKRERDALLLLWLPWLGAFLQVYPRADFAHFLFVFPLAAAPLVWALGRLPRRYPSVPYGWAFFPLALLVLGGGLFQGRMLFARHFGALDPAGFVSYGEPHRLNTEMGEVREFLRAEGLKAGDPVLVLPYATTFYRFSGFRNPTPHNQFFPGYVEAYGAAEAGVLSQFERAGGRYVVLQHGSGLEQLAPEIDHQLRNRYEEQRHFAYQFSVWKLRNAR